MNAPSSARQPGNDVQEERPPARISGVQENREIANLLRDLVRGDGDRRADAERHRGQHRCPDGHAVNEVVNASPTRTGTTLPSWTSQSCVWQ